MRIDENGSDSLGSDHNRLTLELGGATRANLEIGTAEGTDLIIEQLNITADMMVDEIYRYLGKTGTTTKLSG